MAGLEREVEDLELVVLVKVVAGSVAEVVTAREVADSVTVVVMAREAAG